MSLFESLFGKKKPQAQGQPTKNVAATTVPVDANLVRKINLVSRVQPEKPEMASILFVDDDPDLRQYVGEELSDFYDKVYLAANGEEACDLLEKNAVNLVVSDVMMPIMDGQTLCYSIKKSDCTFPVILLTARADNASREEGFRCLADEYIQKPFDIDELVRAINALVQR